MSEPRTVWVCDFCGAVIVHRAKRYKSLVCSECLLPNGTGHLCTPAEVHPLGTAAELLRLRKLFAQVREAWESVDGCPRKVMLEICAEAIGEKEEKV